MNKTALSLALALVASAGVASHAGQRSLLACVATEIKDASVFGAGLSLEGAPHVSVIEDVTESKQAAIGSVRYRQNDGDHIQAIAGAPSSFTVLPAGSRDLIVIDVRADDSGELRLLAHGERETRVVALLRCGGRS